MQWRVNNVRRLLFDLSVSPFGDALLLFLLTIFAYNGCLSTRQLVLPRHPRLFPHFLMSLDFRMEILIITQSVGVLINSRRETSWKAGCAARLNSLKCQLMAGGIINDS